MILCFFLYEKLGLRMSGDTCIYEMGGAKEGGGEVEGREYCCHPVKEKSLSINASLFTSRSRRVLFT